MASGFWLLSGLFTLFFHLLPPLLFFYFFLLLYTSPNGPPGPLDSGTISFRRIGLVQVLVCPATPWLARFFL